MLPFANVTVCRRGRSNFASSSPFGHTTQALESSDRSKLDPGILRHFSAILQKSACKMVRPIKSYGMKYILARLAIDSNFASCPNCTPVLAQMSAKHLDNASSCVKTSFVEYTCVGRAVCDAHERLGAGSRFRSAPSQLTDYAMFATYKRPKLCFATTAITLWCQSDGLTGRPRVQRFWELAEHCALRHIIQPPAAA